MRETVVAAGVAVACAVLMGVSLASLSPPADLKARLATIEQRIETSRRLIRSSRKPNFARAGAVCAEPTGQQTEALKADLVAYAAQLSLTTARLQVVSEATVEGNVRLTPIRIGFEASGSYQEVFTMLDILARGTPEIFVDTLDLKPKGSSSVVLAFSGRAFCAALD